MNFFFSVLGLVMIVEGFPYFCFPDHVKALAEKIHEIDNSLLRILGLVLMVLGLLLIFIGKKLLIA